MKKIKFLFVVALSVFLVACENQEWSFPDYKYSTTYFAYQSPVRTLVMGDYELVDNTMDNNKQFSVGATIAGMYENKKDVKVNFQIDESLAANLYNDKNVQMLALPKAYYSLSSENTIVVPKGKLSGFVTVQLTDAFFDDPIALTGRYVLPVKITGSETDSVLNGKPIATNPDPRISAHWFVTPKNYTLYAVKFINAYHGKYLHRGVDRYKKPTQTVDSVVVYRNKFIESDEIWSIQSTNRNQVVVTGSLRRKPTSPGSFKMLLTFDTNGNCVITKDATSNYDVTGTGKFAKEADTWGGKKRNAIHLNYQVTDVANNEVHTITDTLVIRDRDVRLETFKAVVK